MACARMDGCVSARVYVLNSVDLARMRRSFLSIVIFETTLYILFVIGFRIHFNCVVFSGRITQQKMAFELMRSCACSKVQTDDNLKFM